MDDEKIIELFFRRDEQAIRECMEVYGSYCRAVAAGILSNPADVEEALADTYLAAWDTIPPQRPTCLRVFLGRIARNRSVSIWRRGNAERRGGNRITVALEELNQCVGTTDSPEQVMDARQLAVAINAFLQKQPVQQRQVFLRRYFYLEDIETIAHRYSLRETNVRMMLSRTRQKLRKYLLQEGYL